MHIGIHWTQMPIARGPASVTSYARAPVLFIWNPRIPHTRTRTRTRTIIHLLCMNPCTSIYLLCSSPRTIYLYARAQAPANSYARNPTPVDSFARDPATVNSSARHWARDNSYAGDPARFTASILQGSCAICKSKEEWYFPDSGRSERLPSSPLWLWIRALGCMDPDPVSLLGKQQPI